MTREDAIEFVNGLEEAVNAHDSARLSELYAEDAAAHTPMFGKVVGREAITRGWEVLFEQFPDWRVRVSDVMADRDRVVFFGTVEAMDKKGWFGQPATRERIEYRAIIALTLAAGKIVRDERIYDLTGVLLGLEKTRLDNELKLASQVQRALLSRTEHSNDYCEVAADSSPCRAIGGDFFELTELPSGKFGIALGDVSGKGPASAILAAMIQGMLAVEFPDQERPALILRRLNRLLASRNLESRFATMICGVLSADGRFAYCNAGHNPPIVLSGEGVLRLTKGGPPLGILSDAEFEEETVCLKETDTLVVFSDGVTEANDRGGEELGDERLISCVRANGGRAAREVLSGILESVRDFSGGAAQTDDITAAVLRYRKAREGGRS